MPTLVTKYQKKLVAKRLAHFSSIMQQASKLRDVHIMDGSFTEMDLSEISPNNSDDVMEYVETYWKPYVKFNKLEKFSGGVIGYLHNGSASFFYKHYNGGLYIIFCPEAKHCKEPSLDTDRRTRFSFWPDGRPERYGAFSKPRAELITDCIAATYKCAVLIERDGWEIRDDYPW